MLDSIAKMSIPILSAAVVGAVFGFLIGPTMGFIGVVSGFLAGIGVLIAFFSKKS